MKSYSVHAHISDMSVDNAKAFEELQRFVEPHVIQLFPPVIEVTPRADRWSDDKVRVRVYVHRCYDGLYIED